MTMTMTPKSGGIKDSVKVLKVKEKTFKRRPDRLPWPRKSDPDDNGKIVDIGIDVVAKNKDIIKLVYKFFSVGNIPMEELLQEVFVAIIHKNCTKSAHDPRKSSLGHYVYMVANNVCINLVHKSKRHEKEKESIDAPDFYKNNKTMLDSLEVEQVPNVHELVCEKMEIVEHEMRMMGMWEGARYVRAARSGAAPDVIREALTWGEKRVSNKTMRGIRTQVRDTICKLQMNGFN